MDQPTAQQLVEQYKRSGEFDRLRAEMLEKLMASEAGDILSERVDEIASNSLAKADEYLLERRATDRLLSMIRSDLERFPVVERAMKYLSDDLLQEDEFQQSLDKDLRKLLPGGQNEDASSAHASESPSPAHLAEPEMTGRDGKSPPQPATSGE